VASLGLDLYEVTFKGGTLKVTIDKPGGISLDDCVEVNRALSVLLDAEDPISGSYRLEVSSPGATRRLRSLKEFEYFVGRKVKVRTRDAEFVGSIAAVEGESVVFALGEERRVLSLPEIVKANLEIDI
jgi:ribosome maturation factor RimP